MGRAATASVGANEDGNEVGGAAHHCDSAWWGVCGTNPCLGTSEPAEGVVGPGGWHGVLGRLWDD